LELGRGLRLVPEVFDVVVAAAAGVVVLPPGIARTKAFDPEALEATEPEEPAVLLRFRDSVLAGAWRRPAEIAC